MLEYPKGKFSRPFGDRSFSTAALELCHELPKVIRNIFQSAFLKPLLNLSFKIGFLIYSFIIVYNFIIVKIVFLNYYYIDYCIYWLTL